jgi:hypothetical protein
VQLALGHSQEAATSQAVVHKLRNKIDDSWSKPGPRRRWWSHLIQRETYLQGLPADARVCVWLPRRDAPAQRVAVVISVAAGAASGKVQQRRQQLTHMLNEISGQGALAPVTALAAILNVSERTIKRDLAALRQLAGPGA